MSVAAALPISLPVASCTLSASTPAMRPSMVSPLLR